MVNKFARFEESQHAEEIGYAMRWISLHNLLVRRLTVLKHFNNGSCTRPHITGSVMIDAGYNREILPKQCLKLFKVYTVD